MEGNDEGGLSVSFAYHWDIPSWGGFYSLYDTKVDWTRKWGEEDISRPFKTLTDREISSMIRLAIDNWKSEEGRFFSYDDYLDFLADLSLLVVRFCGGKFCGAFFVRGEQREDCTPLSGAVRLSVVPESLLASS
jgi:hypothetical protein